jgi:hypothetical protein
VALYGITWGSIMTTQVTPARLVLMLGEHKSEDMCPC